MTAAVALVIAVMLLASCAWWEIARDITKRQRAGEDHKKNCEIPRQSALISSLRNAKGLITDLPTVKEDVSDRKQTGEALRQSEDLFRTAFQNAPLGMILSAVDTRIFQVNDRLCQMLGYSQEELLERTWPSLAHLDDVDISRRALDGMLRGGLPSADFEQRYLYKNGSVIWARVRVS